MHKIWTKLKLYFLISPIKCTKRNRTWIMYKIICARFSDKRHDKYICIDSTENIGVFAETTLSFLENNCIKYCSNILLQKWNVTRYQRYYQNLSKIIIGNMYVLIIKYFIIIDSSKYLIQNCASARRYVL